MIDMLFTSEDLYLVSQIRQLESFIIDEGITDTPTLMQRAGQAAFRLLQAEWPNARQLAVFCGKGNNGGDGYVLARIAQENGYSVFVYSLSPWQELREDLCVLAEEAMQAGAVLCDFSDLAENLELLQTADVLVDAMLGIGLTKEVQEDYATAIALMNGTDRPVFSLDIPTGVDADNGRVHGIAVEADVTLTFIALKQGMFTHKAVHHCGKIFCDDLEISEELYRQISPSAHLLTWKKIRACLPKRERDAHKGNYGHVLIVGGDYGMGGAVRMAAEGALRVGAGLVTVATRPEHVSIVNSTRPEIMCQSVNDAKDLDRLIANSTVLVVGPGLGQSDWGKKLLDRILRSQKPKVLDADSLNLLSQMEHRDQNWILTPHPGEAARLLKISVNEVQNDRFAAVTELQQCYGGVAVLKGAGTLIKSDDPVPSVCRAGNPGMASGGMGDVLSGVVGGLLAQGLNIFAAAEVGVFVHAVAADRAVEEDGERGLLASDLLMQLRKLVNPE